MRRIEFKQLTAKTDKHVGGPRNCDTGLRRAIRHLCEKVFKSLSARNSGQLLENIIIYQVIFNKWICNQDIT